MSMHKKLCPIIFACTAFIALNGQQKNLQEQQVQQEQQTVKKTALLALLQELQTTYSDDELVKALINGLAVREERNKKQSLFGRGKEFIAQHSTDLLLITLGSVAGYAAYKAYCSLQGKQQELNGRIIALHGQYDEQILVLADGLDRIIAQNTAIQAVTDQWDKSNVNNDDDVAFSHDEDSSSEEES